MDLFSSMEISASGLSAQRTKVNVVSENLANVETTRTENGGPYKRKMVAFEADNYNDFENTFKDFINAKINVKVSEIVESDDDYQLVHNPAHPDADPKTGYVAMPNINPLTEIADLMVARRAYEANITAISNAKTMILKALEIGK